jgi:predicted phosphoribosyltransferase
MALIARWLDEGVTAAGRGDEATIERIGAKVLELAAGFPIPPPPQGLRAPPRSDVRGQCTMSIRLVEWFQPLFRDRTAAGEELAEALGPHELRDVLVVGLARGGVAVALELARRGAAPLTAVAVARVNAQGLRLGATTVDGPPYLLSGHGVAEDDVAAVIAKARRQAETLERRLELERPPLADRAVLLVDDGLVTGLTLAAACRWARAAGATRLAAAVPVGSPRGLARVAAEADEIICPHAIDRLAVVGQAYDSFDPLDEWYVAGLLAAE